jgi:hypothetical protein
MIEISPLASKSIDRLCARYVPGREILRRFREFGRLAADFGMESGFAVPLHDVLL